MKYSFWRLILGVDLSRDFKDPSASHGKRIAGVEVLASVSDSASGVMSVEKFSSELRRISVVNRAAMHPSAAESAHRAALQHLSMNEQ